MGCFAGLEGDSYRNVLYGISIHERYTNPQKIFLDALLHITEEEAYELIWDLKFVVDLVADIEQESPEIPITTTIRERFRDHRRMMRGTN